MKILSIDIGHEHFAMVYVKLKVINNYITLKYVISKHLIDLKTYAEFCPLKDCNLKHSKSLADCMLHLFKEYNHLFESSYKIIIENQPLSGFKALEQIIYFHYRDKAILISPNSMHAYFDLPSRIRDKNKSEEFCYMMRKKMVVKIAEPYLKHFDDYHDCQRKHDLADAMCYVLYWLSIVNKDLIIEQQSKKQKRCCQIDNDIHNDNNGDIDINSNDNSNDNIDSDRNNNGDRCDDNSNDNRDDNRDDNNDIKPIETRWTTSKYFKKNE
jgi:hypothetical protein